METSFFDYLNELKKDNEQQAKNAEKERERDIKQARRERNIAIFCDLAKLAAQSYAKAGGAWKINEFKPFTKTSNDYIRTLHKQHKEQRIKELNEQKKLNYTIAKAAHDAETKNNQFEQRQQQQQNQFEQRQKNSKQKNNTTRKGAYDTYYLYDEETKTYKPYGNIHAAYLTLPTGYKAVKIYLDNTGKQLIVEDPHPTLQKMQQMINLYNYTKENGIKYDAYNTKPFNIEQGYHNYEDEDLQKPTYNPDGSITFKKTSNQPIKKRRGYDND